jgi:hypothetical protein
MPWYYREDGYKGSNRGGLTSMGISNCHNPALDVRVARGQWWIFGGDLLGRAG